MRYKKKKKKKTQDALARQLVILRSAWLKFPDKRGKIEAEAQRLKNKQRG